MKLYTNGSVSFSDPRALANFEKLATGLKLKPSELLVKLQAANDIKFMQCTCNTDAIQMQYTQGDAK